MKLSWAVLFLVFQAADFQAQSAGNVACLNERQDSCSHCPQLFSGGNRLDFDHCAGDCQIGLTGRSQSCVPKAVNCGQTRESDCSRCPFLRNEDSMRQNMDLCQGDCEVRHIGDAEYCILKDEMTTTTIQAPENPIGAYPSYPTSTDIRYDADPNSIVPYEPDALLTVVKMEIRNTVRSSWNRPSKIKFCAEICVGSSCCETEVMSQRAGIFTFSEDFQNLGTCTQFARHPNQAVRVMAKKVGTETSQSPLRVLTITAQFDDDSLVRAENVRHGWFETTRLPLPWGATRNTVESEVEESNNLPQAHCPEEMTPATNSCPKENVRVHERMPRDARKFCYYQVCTTFTTDLSRVQNEELGSGGYCVPKRQRYPQYKYCCDLEQYFTLPDGNETPRQEINFPRCRSMNRTRNDI